MPPNQNPPNPYEFITTPSQVPTRGFRPTSKKQRISLIVLSAVILIILIVVISSFLGSAGKAQNQKLIELAQTQTEIVRVAGIGVTKATTLETKSLAVNTQLSVESAKQDAKKVLKGRKVKVSDKTLIAAKNTKTDALLQEATNNNRFDQTFTELMQTKLASYQKLAQSVYESSAPSEQKIFQPSFNNISILLSKPSNQE